VGGVGEVKPSGRHCNGDDERGRTIALSRNWLQRPFNSGGSIDLGLSKYKSLLVPLVVMRGIC
jgi:hypothetical protein